MNVHGQPAGAVSGRETCTAVSLIHRGVVFATRDGSYSVNSSRFTNAPGSKLEWVWRSP
jgi:hypothetical protein